MNSIRRGGANLRKNRFSIPGAYYSITTCCANRQPTFADHGAGLEVVASIAALDREGASHSFAFVVMPDHVHWLFRLLEKDSLDGVVRKMKCRSAGRVNKRLGRRGPFWQRGYFESQVISDSGLLKLGDYLLQNPVRAGLVSCWQEYPLADLQWRRFRHLVRNG